MELTTFGAVMEFASQLVMESMSYYERALKAVATTEAKLTLESFLQSGKGQLEAIARVRRENITEMILEPIAGLRNEGYIILVESNPLDHSEALRTALRLEERNQLFFRQASRKVPLPEAARFFRKLAQQTERNRLTLVSLSIGGG